MKQIYEFENFRADPAEQKLLLNGRSVAVTPKVFATLLVLLESGGALIDKDDFMSRLWPGVFVEEVALAKNISCLRKVLADGKNGRELIQTVAKRGYRFTPPVRKFLGDSLAPSEAEVLRPLDTHLGAAGSLLPELPDSIAVFPFKNVESDPDNGYLHEGIAETIMNSLAGLKQLRVVPRATMFRIRDRWTDPIQAGRELRARLVLTGSIVERGNHLIVDAELVDTTRETQLWGHRFTRSTAEVLELQQEIVLEVIKRLQVQLSDDERQLLCRRPTHNREAFLLLMKGLHHANKWSPDGLSKGLAYTRQAIEADPAYAQPYALLAYVYCMLGHFGSLDSADAFPKAKAAARRALELDETAAGVHFTLGLVRLLYDWDWSGAESAIRKGLELAPYEAAGHFAFGEWLTVMGRFKEAVTELERALNLDPLSSAISASLAAAHSMAEQPEQALKQVHKAIELDASFVPAQVLLVLLLGRAGCFEEAALQARKCSALPDAALRGQTALGIVYAKAGRTREARAIADEVERQPGSRRLAQGLLYLYGALGDRDRTMVWLEDAYLARVSNLIFLCRAPELRSLHGDARFDDLLRRIGLPS